MQSHGLQPSRLLCPWDSPGKNTGAGCHFLLQRIFPTQGLNPGLLLCRHSLPTELSGKPPAHTHGSVSFSVMSLCDTMECSLCPWDSPGKNNAVGCHSLLQGIFPIQGLNPHLLHCRQILYHQATWEALSKDKHLRKPVETRFPTSAGDPESAPPLTPGQQDQPQASLPG